MFNSSQETFPLPITNTVSISISAKIFELPVTCSVAIAGASDHHHKSIFGLPIDMLLCVQVCHLNRWSCWHISVTGLFIFICHCGAWMFCLLFTWKIHLSLLATTDINTHAQFLHFAGTVHTAAPQFNNKPRLSYYILLVANGSPSVALKPSSLIASFCALLCLQTLHSTHIALI